MKLSKFDIGAEVISILTRGMYQDPRDALREYVQNGIDAGANDITIKVRQNTVAIIDKGLGMDYKTLRKAIRVGISDKDPKKKVGFMGIGIYSSFHLCDKLVIYSHKQDNPPLKLEMNFATMRDTLKAQRQLRFEDRLDSDELIDLQTLLENCISLTDEGTLTDEDFPSIGTRVELIGLDGNFLNLLSNFASLSNYLREVVPLHFNKDKFKWAGKIETQIRKICEEHNSKFQLINLSLQVNAISENLYRPYVDSDFTNDISNEPIFKEISRDDVFLGVVWACLNSDRKKIPNRDLRGFLIKKQGFAIGNRDKTAIYFKQRTHFDRYVGEIILTNPLILPNASRSDLEYSQYSMMFLEILAKDIAPYYNQTSIKYQERELADIQISDFKDYLNNLNLKYKRDEKDAKVLVQYIVELNDKKSEVQNKDKNASLTEFQRMNFKKLMDSADV
ncbi:DNA mismatch repair protein MutL, partial [termite gut metagenome]